MGSDGCLVQSVLVKIATSERYRLFACNLAIKFTCNFGYQGPAQLLFRAHGQFSLAILADYSDLVVLTIKADVTVGDIVGDNHVQPLGR